MVIFAIQRHADSFFKKIIYLFGYARTCCGHGIFGLCCCMWESFFLFLFFFMLQHMGFSSLPRDQTQAPCIGSAVLATGPPGKSLTVIIMKYPFLLELMLFVLKYTLCKFNIATLSLITSVYMVSFPIILLFIYLCYYINISTISSGNRVQLSLAFLASVTVFPL